MEATELGKRDLTCSIPVDISIRTNKDGQSTKTLACNPGRNYVDSGMFGGAETLQVSALDRSKAAHEFLVLHYFALDSVKH